MTPPRKRSSKSLEKFCKDILGIKLTPGQLSVMKLLEKSNCEKPHADPQNPPEQES